ncbi:MAG: FeoB-associated Cys-rich membrane protein [Oscillospiraceae bacterium]|nr:FeoB-associated Cys-rich membrane protein [Oscillospiraceae bacterium]
MLLWFAEHGADLLVISLLVLACFLILRSMVRRRRAGKGSCGGDCASCGASCPDRQRPPRP